jgi:hypothetical protein
MSASPAPSAVIYVGAVLVAAGATAATAASAAAAEALKTKPPDNLSLAAAVDGAVSLAAMESARSTSYFLPSNWTCAAPRGVSGGHTEGKMCTFNPPRGVAISPANWLKAGRNHRNYILATLVELSRKHEPPVKSSSIKVSPVTNPCVLPCVSAQMLTAKVPPLTFLAQPITTKEKLFHLPLTSLQVDP